MLRDKLLSTLDESERNFKNISKNGLERIAKIQNLSQNDLDQITKMLSLSQNELEQIAKMRRIKNYNNMSKEELLIVLLKSNQSLAELQKSKSNNAEIDETRKIFDELKNNFSKEKIKEIRKKFYGRERIDKYFKELERENILKNEKKITKKYQKEQEKKYEEEQEKKQGLEKNQKRIRKKEYFKKDRKVFKKFKKTP